MANRQYSIVANFIANTQNLVNGFNDARQGAQDAANRVEGAFDGLQGTFKKVATWIGTVFALDKIKDFTLNMIEVTADLDAMNSQYEQVMAGMKGSTDKYLAQMSNEWNKHPSELKNGIMQYYAILRGKGLSEEDAYTTAKAYLERTVDANAFANESMADTVGRFMAMIKGEYSSVDTAMVNLNVTMLDTKAQEQYGKKWAELTVTQQEMLKTQEALRQHTAAGVLGQGAREADSYQNNLAMVKNKYNELLALFGSPVLELANKGLNKIGLAIGLVGQYFKRDWVGMQETLNNTFDSKTALKIENFFLLIDLWIHNTKQFIEGLKPSFQNVVIVIQNLIPIVQLVGGAFGSAIGTMIKAFPPLLEFFTNIAAKFSEWSGFLPIMTGLVAGLTSYLLITKAITLATTVWNTITKVSMALQTAYNLGMMAFTATGGGMAGVLNGLQIAMAKLNLTFLANPIVLIISAIVALGVALVVAYKKSETFRNIVDSVWSSLKDGFFAVINWFTTTLPQWIASVGQWFVGLKNKTVSVFSDLWNSISSATQQFFTFILSALQPFITFFVNSWENLKLLVLSIVTGFFSLLTGDFEGLKLALLGIITAFKDQFVNYWNLLKDTVIKVAVMLWDGIKSGFSAGKDFAINKAIELYNGVISWFQNLYSSAVDKAGNIATGIRNGFSNAKDWAIDMIIKLYNGVVDWIKNIPSKITEMKDDMVKTLKNIDLKQVGKDVIQGFIDGIASKITGVWDKVKEIADGLKKKLEKALDVRSPSRVMFEIGSFVGEGLALGMEGTKSLVEQASLGLANASTLSNDFSRFNNLTTPQTLNSGKTVEQQKQQVVNNHKHINIQKVEVVANNPMEMFRGIDTYIRSF